MLAVRAGVIALGLPLLCIAGDIQKPAILWEHALEGDVYGSALAGDAVVLLTLEPLIADCGHILVEQGSPWICQEEFESGFFHGTLVAKIFKCLESR